MLPGVTTVEYTGEKQVFRMVNNGAGDGLEKVTLVSLQGGFGYNGSTGEFAAQAVGEYTATVKLTDGGQNTQWADGVAGTTRVIKLKITKATLTVTVDDAENLGTSWEQGTVDKINLTVSGVRNGEGVKLNVYYTEDGGSPIQVPDSAIVQSGSDIKITVNLDTFSANKSYRINVELASGIPINNNYTLENGFNFDFFILTATVREVTGNWQVENLIAGTASGNKIFDGIYYESAVYEGELKYNGKPYVFTLDEASLPKGVKTTYVTTGTDAEGNAVTEALNAGTYTTTVTVAADEAGGYTLESSIPRQFTISYEIKAEEYDLSLLTWKANPEYDEEASTPHEMYYDNAPEWLTKTSESGFTNTAFEVGSYTAGYTLYADMNHIFVYTGENDPTKGTVTVDGSGRTALATHAWEILKIRIVVSNSPSQWTTESVTNATASVYDVFVPTAKGKYADQLEIKYYLDGDRTGPGLDATELDADNGIKTYLAVVTVSAEYADSYEVYNSLTGGDSAQYSFTVGDSRTPITVTYNYDDEGVIFDDNTHEVTASYKTYTFGYTYAVQKEDGSWEDLAAGDLPKNAGVYRVLVELTGPESAVARYRVQNKVFYLTIHELVLTTDGWTAGTGNAAPEEKVLADTLQSDGTYAPEPAPKKYYEYEIYKKSDGTLVTSGLEYDTEYVAKLKVADGYEGNVKFAEDAQTEFEFKTELDPSLTPIYVPDPELSGTKLAYNGTEQSFADLIANWDEIKDYVTVERDGRGCIAGQGGRRIRNHDKASDGSGKALRMGMERHGRAANHVRNRKADHRAPLDGKADV